MIIAEHPKLKIKIRQLNNITSFSIPREYFKTALELCENNLQLHITKCTAFDNHIGVHSHSIGSRAQCVYALERLFTRLAKANTLAQYLGDKGFQMTIYAKMGKCFQGEISVSDEDY